VPEWAAFYINYKGLKKLVKAAAETSKQGGEVDLAGGISCPPERTLRATLTDVT